MADEAAAPRPGAQDNRWQNQPAGAAHKPDQNARRRFWLIVLAGLFLALLAFVIIWLLLIKPPPAMPYFLSIHIGEHDNRQYPILPFTKHDGELLARHFPKKPQPETKTKELLRKELAGLADKTEPLIFTITALALAREGKIYLIPGDADPADESTWLDLREVLVAVKECPAEHKLLILELAHPLADARLGVLTDRVAETLEEVVNNEKPPFFVLCPCSAGQYALTSEILQGSVLAYYLDQGLQGNADTKKDLRITVKELFAFLEARVDRWAQQNRALRQKPRLLGNGADFVVATLNKNTPGEEKRPDLEAYPERLQKGWKTRDQWSDDEAYVRAPRLLRKLEANLMRQEKLTRGGAVQKGDVDSLDEDLARLDRQLKNAAARHPVPPRSLALALMQTGAKDNPELVDGVLDILGRAKDATAKKDANAKVEEELLKKLQEPKGIDFPQQAWAVVEALNRMPRLKADHLRVSNEALEKLKPKLHFAEIVYVQRLIAFADRKDADAWHGEKMAAVLQTVRARENLIALLDRAPGLLAWLAADIDAADKLRQTGEDKLLWKGMSMWADGLEKMLAAKAKYEESLRIFDILYRGRSQLDRAFAELPAYMNLICAWPEFDAQAEQSWIKAAEEADKAQALLIMPPTPGGPRDKDDPVAPKLDTHGRELERHLKDLDKMLAKRINRAKKEDKAEALDQLLCLLDSPLLKAPERAALMARQRELAAKLHEATEKQDQDDNEAGRIAALPDVRQRDNLGLTRAFMSLALLRLGKFDFKGKKIAIPVVGNSNSRELADLETQLQASWSEVLPKQWQTARPGYVADALNRTVSPWAMERRSGAVEKDASWMLQSQLRDAFVQWLLERYEAEVRFIAGNAQDQRAGVFYAEAAQELRLRIVEPD